jgi:signal transduction histidine kinase
MSHELRTPLNAIIGFSQVLQGIGRPADTEKIREYATDIEASGQHLLKIINDILEISRIEAGKLELREEEVDVAETIADCLRFVDRRAHEDGIELRWTVCDKLPKIRADKTRLKQILLNLLTNGVKFTPAKGHVAINASTDRDGSMVIAVLDSGIGMSLAEIDVAMQPFRQVDSSKSRRFEGTGLGLPLTKAFIELHGGRLAIESRPGFGTTARVIFPSERVLTGTTSQ